MKLSKLKIIGFFGVLILLLWALYPRGMFLGYIYEGFSNLSKSERYYLDYLQEKPTSKFAITRLAALYERMGEPQKAVPYLEKLYDYRPRDEALAMRYLDLLENLNDEKALYHARLTVAHNLMAMPRPPLQRITELLEQAYNYAEWHQMTEDQYVILADLTKVARNKPQYEWITRHLDFNLKKTDKVVAALQEKLRTHPNDTDALDELTSIYTLIGRYKEAADLINPRLALHPKNPDLLQARMLIDDKTKNFAQLIQDARMLLSLHVLSDEEEWETQGTLAYAYEASRQYVPAMQLYRELLDHDRSNPDHWLAVASILEVTGRYRELVEFLEDYLVRFPSDSERQKMVVEIYLYKLKDLSQLARYRQYIQQHAKVDMALDVANMLVDANRPIGSGVPPPCPGKPCDTRTWQSQCSCATINQPHSGGEGEAPAAFPAEGATLAPTITAIHWLEDMHDLFPSDADIVEMLAQLEAAQKNLPVAKSWYIRLAELRPDPATQLEVGRELFFMNDLKLAEPYLQKIAVQNGEALAWLSEIHAHFKHNKKAVREARQALASGVSDPNLARLMRLRVATADKEWWVAMPLLQEMSTENPQDRFLKNDIRELHRDYDTRLTPTFNFTKYGSEYFSLWGVKFKKFVTHRWELNAEVRAGRFVGSSPAFTGWTETGRVMMTSHHLRPWQLSLGIEGVGSSERTVATPLAAVEYKPTPDTSLKLSGSYRQLRQDFPQAVANGTLLDTAQLEGQTLLWNRLVLSAKYSFEYDRLPSGATAKGSEIEPTASVILFRKPYVTLGWQMDYQRLNSTGNFLTSVPLIPYMNVQYVTGLISGRPVPQLLLEGGFYNGHDFDRGLEFLNGDLWGLRASMEWAALAWLDIAASYEFGRQRVLDIPGYSNVVNFGFSGHW